MSDDNAVKMAPSEPTITDKSPVTKTVSDTNNAQDFTDAESFSTEARRGAQCELLKDAYRKAKENGAVEFENGLSCGELIGRNGQTQMSFLLPNGKQLGARKCIGLPCNAQDLKLHSIRFVKHEGHWLEFSAMDKTGNRECVYVLLSESKGGKDALITYLTPSQYALRLKYQEARQDGLANINRTIGISCPELIRRHGQTQMSFLLPNGAGGGGYCSWNGTNCEGEYPTGGYCSGGYSYCLRRRLPRWRLVWRRYF